MTHGIGARTIWRRRGGFPASTAGVVARQHVLSLYRGLKFSRALNRGCSFSSPSPLFSGGS